MEDENGEIVRETMRDSDAITLYKTMRETLVYLTHLNYDDTENIMLEKLQYQVGLDLNFFLRALLDSRPQGFALHALLHLMRHPSVVTRWTARSGRGTT